MRTQKKVTICFQFQLRRNNQEAELEEGTPIVLRLIEVLGIDFFFFFFNACFLLYYLWTPSQIRPSTSTLPDLSIAISLGVHLLTEGICFQHLVSMLSYVSPICQSMCSMLPF